MPNVHRDSEFEAWARSLLQPPPRHTEEGYTALLEAQPTIVALLQRAWQARGEEDLAIVKRKLGATMSSVEAERCLANIEFG